MHVKLIFFTKITLVREIRELIDYNRSCALLLLLLLNRIHPSPKEKINYVIGIIIMYIGNNIWPAMRFPRFSSNLFMFSHAFHFFPTHQIGTHPCTKWSIYYMHYKFVNLFLTYISNIYILFFSKNYLKFRNFKLWSTLQSVVIYLLNYLVLIHNRD